MGASRACSCYTKIEVSTQEPMVASQSQNGTKVPGPRLDWPALLVPRSQARQSDGLDQSHAQRPSLIAASLPSPDVNDNVLRLRSAFRFGPCVQRVPQP